MTDAEREAGALRVIERFTGEVAELLDPVAVWAHGSLGTDDFQPGRSDLDLITVLREPLSAQVRERLTRLHEGIHREEPDAQKLHCSYMAASQLDDVEVVHFTWAHGQVYPRTVTAVTRCELHRFGRVFHGPPPTQVLPEVSDAELAGFVRESLAVYWYDATARKARWRKDIWVDLGMLTFARSLVTLRDGRLISKREALDELVRLGAPARVVEDIRARRYGSDGTVAAAGAFGGWRGRVWRIRRGALARGFVRDGIRRTLAEFDAAGTSGTGSGNQAS